MKSAAILRGRARIALAAAVALCAVAASACSTIVVGRLASATGRVLVGHAEDDGGDLEIRHGRVPAADWPTGATLPLEPGLAAVPQVTHTFGFWWSEVRSPDGGPSWADAFYNENGVWVVSDSAGVSRAADLDGGKLLTDGGVVYAVRRAVAERAKSARDAVDVIAGLVGRWGYAQSGRIYVVADRDEAWLVQLVRGRTWAARRCPDDAILFLPNHYTIHDLPPQPTADCRFSADVRERARANGWWDGREPFDFAAVYQADCWRGIPHNTERRRFALRLLLGREPGLADFGFSVKAPRKYAAADLERVLTAHPADVTPHVDDRDTPALCRRATVETTVCAFGATVAATEIALAAAPACEKGFTRFRPLGGEPDPRFEDGDGPARLAARFLPRR